MRRRFTIYTDHKPLVKLFDSQQATLATGAARIQRWSLYLSNFNYQVEYRNGCDISNADAFSRLPLSSTESTLEKLSNVQPVQLSLIESTPIDLKQCRMATIRNPILSKVLNFVHRGWPDKCPSEELRPYYLLMEELTIEDSILLWGLRVVVLQTLRFTMLNLLHNTHIGVVRMKGLARSSVWWPGIDADIDRLCSQCVACAQHSKDPAKSPLSVWDFPSGQWQRIHIDYAGPFYGSMWLIWIDAYSKYGGAEQVSSANGFNTVR